MFGFITNFFGGIFSFFGGLLGFKKSEYFLDLGNSDTNESPKVELAAAKKPEPVVAAPAVAKADSPKKAKAETSQKSQKEKEPVKVAAATNGKVSSSTEPTLTFAPNNLMPIPTASRRTPGPSMNGFRDMARQVKTK
ncbi:MAG: hypothetical protein QQW96_00895 [Tychonema bourrellyi B0820]|uniref:Uncharacterized protein n=1 Tax=Tychonema bourrellyi FEM_GT703 TaxID=2040638 RepID=A0A2G4F2A6_9CYAN|nr:hypothetical protein [Tychonema bourrellyi]MDQ2096195.1 hypothetical protein [Tychonema bourrellyi B0820]PHX55904.1 hypothetical protein CP500_008390 [Tychonema bourrellyi FEM_GT703]